MADLFLGIALDIYKIFVDQYLPRFFQDPVFWDLLDELGSHHEDLNFQAAESGAEDTLSLTEASNRRMAMVDDNVLLHLTISDSNVSA